MCNTKIKTSTLSLPSPLKKVENLLMPKNCVKLGTKLNDLPKFIEKQFCNI